MTKTDQITLSPQPVSMRSADSQAVPDLNEMTDARVALGRFGAGMPTRVAQAFLLDHARAREAVWSSVDWQMLEQRLSSIGLNSIPVKSCATDRSIYVRRPDLGRRLSAVSHSRLDAADAADLAIVVADGLSASAVETNAVPLIERLMPRLQRLGLSLAPIVLAEQARVALGDPVGEALRAHLTIVLIGERPGLSAADSLGAYITYEPRTGVPDSKRNCISNIRDGGLSCDIAAVMITDLVADMIRAKVSGVALKDSIAALE